MVQIVKGDSYYLPFTIKQGSTTVTPSNVDDVRIQINDTLKSYSASELTFDTSTNEWKYWLSQEQTLAFTGNRIDVQVGIKIGSEVSYSDPISVFVGQSIINKEW